MYIYREDATQLGREDSERITSLYKTAMIAVRDSNVFKRFLMLST